MHAYTADDSRGRTFAAFYTGTRVATFAALGLAPFLAGSIEVITVGVSGTVAGQDAQVALGGVRITMLLGGLVALWFSLRSARAIWRAAGPNEPVEPASAATDGLLIAFEGVEGSGKTTQAARLTEHLGARGVDVVSTREPGGTPAAEAIREILLAREGDALDDRAEALLYAAARAEHVTQVIAPALRRGAVVVSDRYVDSSLAYQGHGRGLEISALADVNRWATGGTRADLVVLLDLPASDGLERARRRRGVDAADRLEGQPQDFHERVAAGFAALAKEEPDRFVVIDASGDIDEVAAQVAAVVEARLGLEAPEPVEEPS